MNTRQDDPPPSDAGSVGTFSSATLTNPDLARIFVRFSNGTKIVVPVPQNALVDEVHRVALLRAARLGITATIESTVLETTGKNVAVVFGEDSLADIMDLTEDNTFSMRLLSNIPNSALDTSHEDVSQHLGSKIEGITSHDTANKETPAIYIRWISLEDAMSYPKLRKIPVDNRPFPHDTTLHDFHQQAVERLCDGAQKGSCTNSTNLNLFLKECILHTENNFATLGDIVTRGGKQNPLDIFVEFTGPQRPTFGHIPIDSAAPNDRWSFDSTTHGMSTYVTSLQILLKEISESKCSLDNICEVLLELTHFPPVLAAFQSLYESGVRYCMSSNALLLVASAFYEICRGMTTTKLCPNSKNRLEISRQAVCWIYSLRSESCISRGVSTALIHRAFVRKVLETVELTPPFQPFQQVSFPLSSPGTGSEMCKFVVSAEIGDKISCNRLGVALNQNGSSCWDFYFYPTDGDWDTLWDHQLVLTPKAPDFSRLIEGANSTEPFKMVGPLQLGGCVVAQLPLITLSAKGYVSKYDHEDVECGNRVFVTWNAIEGQVRLPDNPGQFLSQQLDPIVVERKKAGNWDLDAWPEWTSAAAFGTPEEAIVVCVDTSSSMGQSMRGPWLSNRSSIGTNPSRLTEVKEFFKNLALRISALSLPTHLALITFSKEILEKQPLTPLHLNFSQQLDDTDVAEGTAIYDALYKSCSILCNIKDKHPETKCRIILLTDGEDTVSTIVPSTVSQILYKNDIVLDAIVIGTNKTKELFKIASHTGGYAFHPQTQQSLFQIFLLETMVDIRTRPDVGRPTYFDWSKFEPKEADMKTPFDFPPCRPHPNINDEFIALGQAEHLVNRLSRRGASSTASTQSSSSRPSSAATAVSGPGGLSRILLSEIKAMVTNAHDYMDVYVSQSNMGFWKVVMQGPPESPYEKGTFLLFVEIGEEFPRRPPMVRFVTPILHPNVTKHGRICHPIFDREWSPTTRIYSVLQQIYGILMSLEARDAVDPLSALRFWSDEQEGRREVEEYVQHFAHRTRASYHIEIAVHDLLSFAYTNSSSNTSDTASASTVVAPSKIHSRFPISTARSTSSTYEGESSDTSPSYRSVFGSGASGASSTWRASGWSVNGNGNGSANGSGSGSGTAEPSGSGGGSGSGSGSGSNAKRYFRDFSNRRA